MKPATLTLLALAAGAPWLASQGLRGDGGMELAVEQGAEGFLVTLEAESAPLDRVCEKLAAELGCELEGLDATDRSLLITAHLERRPLEVALEYVLGSVGLTYRLRTGMLSIAPDDAASLDRDGLLQRAGDAYARALAEHPAHACAAAARLDQGEIAELQGLPGAALDHYQELIERHPRAPEVAQATMRSGLVLASLGRWAEAAERFRTLTGMELADADAAAARLELARCTVELGDPQSALFLLASLEQGHPTDDPLITERRELVRALALVGTHRHLDGLRAVEAIEAGLSGADRIEGLRIRALALQGAGHPGEAARAWTLFAEEVGEPLRASALEQAAKLALAAEDEVGALFVVRQAEAHGHALRFAPYKEEAYARLGFKTEAEPHTLSAAERITAGEEKLAASDVEAAAVQVRHLIPGAGALAPDLRTRLAVVWSACVARAQGFEPALEHLRDVRATLAGDEHAALRSQLDLAAASLLEAQGLYDRAADAYRGVY